MPSRQKRSFWRTCRIYFRRFRITVWLVVLAILGILIYLDQVGLPGFAKRLLLQRLHERGLDLHFSRLRLSWYRGIVAENVRFERADQPSSPRLTLKEVRVQLSHKALAHLQFQVDSLVLRRGLLVWPLEETNQPNRDLSITNLQAVLRFLPNDEWALDTLKGRLAGATFQLSGTITNASAIRDWEFLKAKQPPAPASVWQDRLRRFADTLDRIRFAAPPDLRLDLRGDARDLQSFSLRAMITAPGAVTPWGRFSQAQFTARLFPAGSNDLSRVDLNLAAADAQTPWATTHDLRLGVQLTSLGELTNVVNADLVLAAGVAVTEWAAATNAHLAAQWTQYPTNPIPLAGHCQFRAKQAGTRWGSAKNLQLTGDFASPPASGPPRADDSWAFWTNLQPYFVHWEARLTDLQSSNLLAEELACAGTWRAPALAVTNLHARLYRGKLDAHAELNVASRALRAGIASDFDPRQVAPLLAEDARRWLEDVKWEQPPALQANLALTLPAWTNREPDWRAEVLPTLELAGEFKLDHSASYRGVEVSAVRSHVLCSNLVWQLPDLLVTRREGQLQAMHVTDGRASNYYWRVSSTIDPLALRSLVATNEQDSFDLATFTQPPVVEAELWGRFHEPQRIGFRGRVAVTNFTFRGQSTTGLQTEFQYTNRVVQFIQPRVQRGDELMSADGVTADFNVQLIYLTNGVGTIEPLFIARAIGPHIVRDIRPYHFILPPAAYVHGTIPMHGETGADLQFDINGGPLEWQCFYLSHLAGHLHWRGEELFLTNVTARAYGGNTTGSAHFEFLPGGAADYSFQLTTKDTQLKRLLDDISGHTNKIEGSLDGTLTITHANTEDTSHVNGYGRASLREGLIWEIPLFGIFSPVLDDLFPGLGSSRFNAGTCSFTITNSVIHSEDLELRARTLRLQYRGTVDFNYRLNARVEAIILRDVPVFGPALKTIFKPFTKLFEFKVTGTLSQPRKEQAFLISKFILMPFELPFHPFRTLRDLFPEDMTSSRTNAPPVEK